MRRRGFAINGEAENFGEAKQMSAFKCGALNGRACYPSLSL